MKDSPMKRILVVDDDESIRTLYADELTGDGYRVSTCADISTVMTDLRKFGPDLLILDVAIGPRNSLDLLQEIRKDYPRLPIILCTGHFAFQFDPKSAAADAYITKGSDLAQLKERVRALIGFGRDPAASSP